MPWLASPYPHRCPTTLPSTLTRKILSVKVREEIPTSPASLHAACLLLYTPCRSTDSIPLGPAPCPFTHPTPAFIW